MSDMSTIRIIHDEEANQDIVAEGCGKHFYSKVFLPQGRSLLPRRKSIGIRKN